MTKISQGNAVLTATILVLETMGKKLDPNVPATEQLGQDGIVKTRAAVEHMFKEGVVGFSDSTKHKYDTEEKVRQYVIGLCNNWWRKDTKLNGGVKYEPSTRKSLSTEEATNIVRNLFSKAA